MEITIRIMEGIWVAASEKMIIEEIISIILAMSPPPTKINAFRRIIIVNAKIILRGTRP